MFTFKAGNPFPFSSLTKASLMQRMLKPGGLQPESPGLQTRTPDFGSSSVPTPAKQFLKLILLPYPYYMQPLVLFLWRNCRLRHPSLDSLHPCIPHTRGVQVNLSYIKLLKVFLFCSPQRELVAVLLPQLPSARIPGAHHHNHTW